MFLEMAMTKMPAATLLNANHLAAIDRAQSFSATNNQDVSRYLGLIRGTMLDLVRRDGRDLTTLQLTTLMAVYLQDEVYSVGALAKMLNISRPGVTRILDRLVKAKLVSRAGNPEDRRVVLVSRTTEGARYVNDLGLVAVQVARYLSIGHLG
jgi:DNA-binding MarR family transcriptional regulator